MGESVFFAVDYFLILERNSLLSNTFHNWHLLQTCASFKHLKTLLLTVLSQFIKDERSVKRVWLLTWNTFRMCALSFLLLPSEAFSLVPSVYSLYRYWEVVQNCTLQNRRDKLRARDNESETRRFLFERIRNRRRFSSYLVYP